MRILFTTQPAYGHFHPLLPLAEAARDAGDEVVFATSALFAPVVEAAGFKAVPVGMNWLEADKSTVPDELKPDRESSLESYFAQQFVTAPAEPLARDVVRLAERWRPDLIIRERTEFGGAIAADALGIPVVAVQVASPSLMTPGVHAAIEGPYNAARRGLGLEDDPGLVALKAQVVLSFSPPSLHDPDIQLPSNLVSFRPVALDRSASDRLAPWAASLGNERPLVYATLGTVFNNPAYELPFFPAVLAALRDEPIDLLLTVGPNVDPASLGHQPANIRIEAYVPQSLIFPKCAAIVCHGGFGTLIAAIEHAVPLVVVPFGADQPINARSVERLGLGLVIEEEALTEDRMRQAVRSVIEDPRWRRNIKRLRDEAAALPVMPDALDLLHRLAAEYSRDRPSTGWPNGSTPRL